MSLSKDALRRFRSIRTSLLLLALVPSLALSVVWLVAAGGQLSQALDLRDQTSLGKSLAPSGTVLRHQFELERRLTAAWLAEAESSRTTLLAQRARTDDAIKAVMKDADMLDSAPDGVRIAISPLFETLRQLPLRALRERIDQREISITEATETLSRVPDVQMAAVGNVSTQVPDGPLVAASIPLGSLLNAITQIQLEDTTLSAALPGGRLTPTARTQFITAVGTQRWLLAALKAQTSPADWAAVQQVTQTVAWQRMTAVENAVLTGKPDDNLSASAQQWRTSLDRVGDDFDKLAHDKTSDMVTLQASTADDQVQRGLLLSATGLFAVLASVMLSWRVTRSLLQRLIRLREATTTLAEKQLPDVVARLNRGERVDVSAEAMELDSSDDELGEVTRAFNSAQRTAVSSAVELADARRGFEKAILGTARHTQNLVNRQVELLDKLEREHQEPDVLAGLYQLDSQANQMRRYEENLIVISGGRPGRQWREPVLLTDILRGAAGEVAEYQRITVQCDHHTRLVAHAVADVIHLLAELMENATQFSPEICPVLTRVDPVGMGLAIQIEDRGIGMSERDCAQVNDLLSKPPRFEALALGDDTRLGLFVVSRLAARHAIKVALRPSVFGGMAAIALIPEGLIVREHQQSGFMPGLTPGFVNEHVPGAGRAEGQPHVPGRPTPARPTRTRPTRTRPAHGRPGADFPPPPAVMPFPGEPFLPSPPAPAGPSFLPSPPEAAWPSVLTQPDADPPTPLPQRIPEASMAEELRTEHAPQLAPLAYPSQQATSAMSAFVRGTRRARTMRNAGSSYSEP
ncbi:nitrate- and nitrite sensing domain-containing protein [Streptomyces sp. NBC_01485]|uniref:sensor histidine kinase n=1 Tax=Streptomyces sp. NBC_01485 TaxID=2903884 RepID=UPI002E319E5B|nr:nitrate- and nitrite sensing domain-containing protein [Streptomyces sp. NBC_01485]